MAGMKPKHAAVLAVALVSAAVTLVCWRAASGPATPQQAGIAESEQQRDDGSRGLARGAAPAQTEPKPEAHERKALRESAAPNARLARNAEETVIGAGGESAAGTPSARRRARWPVRAGAPAESDGSAKGDPAVPADLAFLALKYVGVDAGAEKTWLRAINDPSMPAGVRSDLIEDLNDEGYTNDERPTHEDLPLILARLEIVERYYAFAMDEVNASAFQEAYKDLLALYVRLSEAPSQAK
jgi:hypothetical protein